MSVHKVIRILLSNQRKISLEVGENMLKEGYLHIYQSSVDDALYFSLLVDFLSLIMWGVKNGVTFKDKNDKKLRSFEVILSKLESDDLHISTNNFLYLKKLQKTYLEICHYKKIKPSQ